MSSSLVNSPLDIQLRDLPLVWSFVFVISGCHNKYSQSWNLRGPTALSEIRWCATFPRSWFQSRWQSLCQGSVLPNYPVFKETLRKISWTLRNHLSAWHSIVHPPSSRVHAFCSSSLSCVHAWTCHIQHFLWENTAGLRSSHNWRGTWIWNFLDSGFKNRLLTGMQTLVQGDLARLWRHWRRIWMDPRIQTHSCCGLGIWFPHCISRQAWSSLIVLNTLLHLFSVSVHF